MKLATVGRIVAVNNNQTGFRIAFLDYMDAKLLKPKIIQYLEEQGFIVTVRKNEYE
jgi:hypothetical protein